MMPTDGAETSKRAKSSSPVEPTDPHLAWVPLPLARDLIRATHLAHPERTAERFTAAMHCWETLCRVALWALDPGLRFEEISKGAFGTWAGALTRRAKKLAPAVARSPHQDALRQWAENALGRTEGSRDVTLALLALLPSARNTLTAAHYAATSHLDQLEAPALALAALAEVLEEGRLLPQETSFAWVSSVTHDEQGSREAVGFLLRGTDARRLRQRVPEDVAPGGLYLVGKQWTRLPPWILASDGSTSPTVLMFSQGEAQAGRVKATYFDVFEKHRRQLDDLGELGRIAGAGLLDACGGERKPGGHEETPAESPPRRRPPVVGALGATLLVAASLASTWLVWHRDIVRQLPMRDWRVASQAGASDWSLMCRRYEQEKQLALAAIACDQAVATASSADARSMVIRRAQLARGMGDRDAAIKALADPRIGRFDDALESLTAWACAPVDARRVRGFVGHRVLRASAEQPVGVFTGNPAPGASGKSESRDLARELVTPTCAAVGSPSISPTMSPTTWLYIDLPELGEGKWPGVVPTTAIGASDPESARLCRLRLNQGRAVEAKRECATASWSDDETTRRVGVAGTIQALHQQRELEAELDWLGSATKTETAEVVRLRVQQACFDAVGALLPARSPTERFRLVTWQWKTRTGNLNTQPKLGASDNQKTEIRRGTCVLVDSSGRVDTMSRARLLFDGRELTGWMDAVLISP